MKVMIDLNVLRDVVQKRLPHYFASALTLSSVLNREVEGVTGQQDAVKKALTQAEYWLTK